MENNTILVIDDDRNILAIIELYLKKEGYDVVTCTTGYDAMSTFRSVHPTLVVLDVMLPGQDGWSILHEIRQESKTPVIMLTAKGDTGERVRGLELGADDYIAKPFDSNELVDLQISLENYSVILDGEAIDMPPKEIELLYFLASHSGKVFTREQLLEQVWGFDFFGDSRTVDVHVKRIREKLGERDAWQLKTVWGVGYKFELRS